MKSLDMSPCHVLEYRGLKFALDPETMAIVQVDDVGCACLEELIRDPSVGAAAAALERSFPSDQVEKALAEVLELRRRGLFIGPVTTYDEEDYDRQIARLLRMGTGKIELYLAEACNLRCKYCYVNSNDALDSGLMPEEVALAAVDLAFRRGRGVEQMQVTFFGGEPLLNKPVMKSVIAYSQERARKENKKMFYSLTTNATLMDDEVIGLIKRYNFGLMISIDGPPEVHDDIRCFPDGSGSFAQAAGNVKRLMRRRRQVTCRCTVSNRHLNLYDIVTFLEDFGFTRVGVSYCQGKSYELGPYDIGPQHRQVIEREMDRLFDRWMDQVRRGEPLKFDPFSGTIRSIHKGRKQRAPMLSCGVCRGCTTVGVDGSLYPCHRYVGMRNYVVGDVWSGVSDEAHERYLRAYFETKKKCASCWAVNICGGMCAWYVSHEDGTCRPPPKWRCDSLKRWLERGAWMYDKVRKECPEFLQALDEEPDENVLVSRGRPTPVRPKRRPRQGRAPRRAGAPARERA